MVSFLLSGQSQTNFLRTRDLYIQAIQTMQDMDSADDLSWFQIAAIHGMPFNEWDGAGPKQGDGWLGYCPHVVGSLKPMDRSQHLLTAQNRREYLSNGIDPT